MKLELFPFQKTALAGLRTRSAEALGSYRRTHSPQVVSFTAPTGAGKTIIMASLIESIYFGDDTYLDQQNAIFVWLSDSPQLNEQSKQKIDLKADKIRLDQCITITEETFDREVLDDGHIYFLNTQKLSKSSNLTKHSDTRHYTIWETLANTARTKSDRLYLIIDEAHRGMHGREASRATTIMQKFIKGNAEDGLDPMPVVIGMSATSERFNRLVEGTSSTIHKIVITADEVRASGLLKDRIVITYPEENALHKDMAVLQAAADDWKQKWDHWTQYCREQHYAYVNPIFVIQVLNSTGSHLSDTDLDDCLRKIEERTGFHFSEGEVVHTFGQTASILVNGLNVRYEEPSHIADDRNIKVVFFKENLSTGWDCPRAETMMSFRCAKDATYIAQLLGRMIRTPMQMRILVDEVLNDVHLYLPYFDADTVQKVVEELQNAEGGNISTDIVGESLDERAYETLTIRPERSHTPAGHNISGQMTALATPAVHDMPSAIHEASSTAENRVHAAHVASVMAASAATSPMPTAEVDGPAEPFDRESVVQFINDYGLLTYDVRGVRISNYLTSLYKMARFLTQTALSKTASREVIADIVRMIHDHTEKLKLAGRYDELTKMVQQFKLSTQIFDVFGETVNNSSLHDMCTTTDTDIDRQFRLAETKLGNEGVANEYGRQYFDAEEPNAYKIDVIIFTADNDCIQQLHTYAANKFHSLDDAYRRYVGRLESDRFRKQYNSIVSDGDVVSKHNFRLPETIQVVREDGGQEYRNHLFVNQDTGTAVMKLNGWETGVIAEEEKKPDFVCWLRNPPRKSWSLCIPYTMNNEIKPAYPDFIVIRKDAIAGYVIDILEPHNPEYIDNLSKAKGFAEYARQNPGVGRIQLIRMAKDIVGKNRFKRLDMSMSAVRDKVSRAINNEELDHIFDTDGFFE